ncbi:MAG: VWA domain-containing protein [Candidatus Poribacteria bacterium]|nr:VWA domain-containing protein [Candidatus Poribacteria bacterium]MDE0315067.1 VWA domain-containing protein [Candidatus Poribacteria bacterium]
MNSHLLRKSFRQQYRKRALRISVGVHVLFLIIFTFFFLRSQVTEIEDEIQVDIISELPRQNIEKKKETPKEKIPIPREERILEKKETVAQPKQSLEIAKMSPAAQTQVEIHEAAPEKIDVSVPILLEMLDLSTDADLKPAPESVLAPISSATSDTPGKSYGRRGGTGLRTPGKGTGAGIGKHIKGTGAVDEVGKIDVGIGGSSLFGNTLKDIAENIIQSSDGAPIDVVFVVDISGSMHDKIRSVADHLGQMIDFYEASGGNYALGLTLFTTFRNRGNDIEMHPLTTNVDYIKQLLYAIEAGYDENILDAIDQTVRKMQFRKNTIKHLILVSDERKLETQQRLTADHVIQQCQKNQIHVNVLGVNNQDHKRLATDTGGIWHAIPQDTIAQKTPISNPYTAQAISKVILKDATNMPVDIILFIDGSKSMENKMLYLRQQIDFWLRDWDIALIDYRVGVVRFRADGTVNMVNVFKPSQTQQQIHAILQLPCQKDENLIHAVAEGTRRIKFRPNAKKHFILMTDEPVKMKSPTGTIQFLQDIPVIVSVIGTSDTFQQQVAQQTGGIWVAMPNGHKMNKPNH